MFEEPRSVRRRGIELSATGTALAVFLLAVVVVGALVANAAPKDSAPRAGEAPGQVKKADAQAPTAAPSGPTTASTPPPPTATTAKPTQTSTIAATTTVAATAPATATTAALGQATQAAPSPTTAALATHTAAAPATTATPAAAPPLQPSATATQSTVTTQLVTNGGFENPDLGGSGYLTLAAGPSLYGWAVEAGSVDVIGSYWPSAAGHQSLDLNGSGPGVISQSLETQSGQAYSLQFALAGNPTTGGAKAVEVWWGSVLVDTISVDTTPYSTSNMGWVSRSYAVNATSSATQLRFKSLTANQGGVTLDAISVTAGASSDPLVLRQPATPVPSPTAAATATKAPATATAIATATIASQVLGSVSSGSTGVGATGMTLTSTYNSVGVEVPFAGDANANAGAHLEFKPADSPEWRQGLPLWRTDDGSSAPGRAFYGSALLLDAGTTYDVRVTLSDQDGVAGSPTITGTIATRADAVPPAGALLPTHHVRTDGSDSNSGVSPSSAWRTIEKAIQAAPAGAVVQVGPGTFSRPSTTRATPLTLLAQYPAVDDGHTAINHGLRTVIHSGVRSAPAGSGEPNAGVWQQVTLTGPGYAGAPRGAAYRIWKWAGPAARLPGTLGFASSSHDLPERSAAWSIKGTDLETPAGWVEKLFSNRSYNFGWAGFPDGAGRYDIYARFPGDLDPNGLYVTLGSIAGTSGDYGHSLNINGPSVRVSGIELRDGVRLLDRARDAVIDHNLIGMGGVHVSGNRDVTPMVYGSGHLVERNRIMDSGLWSDHGSPAIAWGFIKGNIQNADGSLYGSNRLGEGNESNGIFFRGGAHRMVIRHNTIDGPFNGIGAYNSGYDRYATQDTDIHDNLIRHIADDAFEPEQVAINWRAWNNRIESAAVVLSTGPVAYGPIYLFRNEAWRIERGGVGKTNDGDPGVASVFFKYSGASSPRARIYVLHNTFWTDSQFSFNGQTGTDAAAQYAGGGSTPEDFYARNNIMHSTRYAFAVPGSEDANQISTTDAIRGVQDFGKRYTTDVAGYRKDYLAQRGQATSTNIAWTGATNNFVTPPALVNAPGGDLSLPSTSPLIDAGVLVANIADRPGIDFTGAAPDIGARER